MQYRHEWRTGSPSFSFRPLLLNEYGAKAVARIHPLHFPVLLRFIFGFYLLTLAFSTEIGTEICSFLSQKEELKCSVIGLYCFISTQLPLKRIRIRKGRPQWAPLQIINKYKI